MRTILVVILSVLPLAAADPVRVTTDGGFKQHLQWSPDGKTFLLTRIQEGKMAAWTMTAGGKDAKRLLPNHVMPHFDASWAPDGKHVVYVFDELQGTDGKLRIHSCAADGGDDKTIVPHKAFEESPRLAPDGKRLLWVSTRHGNPELYTVDADGKNETRLTSEVALDLHPAWSFDGRRIAFSSSRTGKQKLYTMKGDGTDVKKLTDGEHLDGWPAWSRDGKQIAFVSNRGGNYDIWLVDADGKNPRNLTNHAAQDTSPTWSADGKSLAFLSTRDGGTDVYIMNVAD